MIREQNVICIQPEYPLLPETNGRGIIACQTKIISWIFERLPLVIKDKNPFLKIDWRVHLSGSSFGGGLALDLAFNAIPSHPNPPADLRIKLHIRYGLTKLYSKEPGDYMGVPVSRKEAEAYSHRVREMRDAGVMLIPVAGRVPPNGMHLAYCTSVSGTWEYFWEFESIWERLERNTSPLPYKLAVRLDHGKSDRSVPYKDTVELEEMLKAKYPETKIEVHLIEGKDHGYDYNDGWELMKPWYLEWKMPRQH